jgi:hypothetical protein
VVEWVRVSLVRCGGWEELIEMRKREEREVDESRSI